MKKNKITQNKDIVKKTFYLIFKAHGNFLISNTFTDTLAPSDGDGVFLK